MIETLESFAARVGLKTKLLVLAPHPDDETIGCGGLIALAAAAGLEVVVVQLTDGGASHRASQRWPRARLAMLRKKEMSAALRVLGVRRDAICLDLPDAETGELSRAQIADAREFMASILLHERPDILLTTWRREPHCDHRFAYGLARDALQLVPGHIPLVEYMVWTTLTGTVEDFPREDETRSLLLDVSSVRALKVGALQRHESQLGGVVDDDPYGFRLTSPQIVAMTGPVERYEHQR